MPELSAILAKPEEYGFTFLTETVKRDKMSSGPVPLIKLTDLAKFDENFPGVVLETEDGQSIRVNSQRVVRDAWFAGDKDQLSLKTRLIRWLMKIETPQAKYMGYMAADGKAYPTQDEAVEASIAWANAPYATHEAAVEADAIQDEVEEEVE